MTDMRKTHTKSHPCKITRGAKGKRKAKQKHQTAKNPSASSFFLTVQNDRRDALHGVKLLPVLPLAHARVHGVSGPAQTQGDGPPDAPAAPRHQHRARLPRRLARRKGGVHAVAHPGAQRHVHAHGHHEQRQLGPHDNCLNKTPALEKTNGSPARLPPTDRSRSENFAVK